MTSVTPASGSARPHGAPPRRSSGGGFLALLFTVLGAGLLAGGAGRATFLAIPDATLLEAPFALALILGGAGSLGIGAVLAARGRSTSPGAVLLAISFYLTVTSLMAMSAATQMLGPWYWISDRFGFETVSGLRVMLLTGVLPATAAVLLGGAIGARRSAKSARNVSASPGTAQPGGSVTPGLTVSTVDSSLTGPSGPSGSAAIAALLGTVAAGGGLAWTVIQGTQAMQELQLTITPLPQLALMLPGVVVLGIAAYLVRWTRLHLWLVSVTLLGLTLAASVMPRDLALLLEPVMGTGSYTLVTLFLRPGLLLGFALVLAGIAIGSRMEFTRSGNIQVSWYRGDTTEPWLADQFRSGRPGSGPASGSSADGPAPGTPASGQAGGASPYGPPPTGEWPPPTEGPATGPSGNPTNPFGPPGPQQRF